MAALENCKLASFFRILKSSFSNLHNHLTVSEPYLLRIISATDLFAGNLSFSKNKNTSTQTLTIKTLKKTLSLFDFAYLSCSFLVGNDSKLVKIKQVHYKKLHALGKDNSIGAHDLDKVIFNYSSHKLSDIEKKVLVRGLNFALPPVKLSYRDYLTTFELLLSYQFPTLHWNG